ncbi:MAG: matrixin family metalloprotease [Alphaproteobacteria bacterium]|nr:matrixin family metalloprotease [Alphaproteobacteria bacterium]
MRKMFCGILFLAVAGLAAATAHAESGYRLLQMDDHDVKWGRPVLGAGASLTYAVVDGPTSASGTVNCRSIGSIAGVLTNSGVPRRVFDAELSAAFAMWENVGNVRFFRARNAASADVLISAEAKPDGLAYADVTTVSSSNDDFPDVIRKGIICLNPDVDWIAAVPAAMNLAGARSGRKSYKLRYILAHEIGHVLGLDHPSPVGELMSFEYNANLNGLQPGDIAGIVALYGPSRQRPAPLASLNARIAGAP